VHHSLLLYKGGGGGVGGVIPKHTLQTSLSEKYFETYPFIHPIIIHDT
jgi:hypothetical protein